MTTPIKKQLGLIDLDNVPARAIALGSLPTEPPSNVVTRISLLFAIDGLFINRRERRLGDGRRGSVYQFEMPLSALSWIVDMIEQQFERKPSAGGLPRAVFHATGTIAGERLEVRYGASVAGEGIGGYTITNFTRQSYILSWSTQEMSFSIDDWRTTVRGLFRDLACRYEAGELG